MDAAQRLMFRVFTVRAACPSKTLPFRSSLVFYIWMLGYVFELKTAFRDLYKAPKLPLRRKRATSKERTTKQKPAAILN